MIIVELPPFSFKLAPEFFDLFFVLRDELIDAYLNANGGDGGGKEKRVSGKEGS
jgi:hypothetical protein